MSTPHKKGKPILGIDINSVEIRVVEVEGAWPAPELLRAGNIATPPGAMNGEEVLRPDLIAKALIALLATMETKTRSAVMGIPSACVASRVLDIPHVPLEEILSVVQGEIVHQRILPNPNGEFDYLTLQTGDLRRQARPRLLLMAAESRFLNGHIAAAAQAGLNLIALEPGLPAMYRAASPTSYQRSPCLCLLIGSTVSEVAIMDQGPIRLYRRIDMGARQFMGDMAALADVDTTGVEDEIAAEAAEVEVHQPRGFAEEDEASAPPSIASEPIEISPARSLLIELQRSMDYYHREYPEAPSVHSIVVACGSQELTAFLPWLSNALHIATVPAALVSYSTIASAELKTELEGPDGYRYLRAGGLAMRGLDQLPSEIPAFDLLRHDADEAKKPRARNNLAIALAACIVLMLGCCLNVLRLARSVASAQQEFTIAQQESQQLRSYRGLPIDEVRRQKSIRDIVVPPGLPIPTLIDAVTASMPVEAAVTDISTDSQGTVMVQGDAGADTVLVQLLDTLRQQPEFTKVSLEKLDRNSVTLGSTTLHYQIAAKTK